jgi:glutathione S-transferase
MTIQLYDLCGADPARVFSPFCWRIRMALAEKGLAFESIPWRFTETDRLAFADHRTVPVLVDRGRAVGDSWAIAEYLDAAYPDRSALFRGPAAGYRFTAMWAETVLHREIASLIVTDILEMLRESERAYFIESREARYGRPLAEVTAGREARLPAFREALRPLRAVFAHQPFLGGPAPDWADMMVFGAFMWARVSSPLALLEPGDAVHAWQERMLDRQDGFARRTPARAA